MIANLETGPPTPSSLDSRFFSDNGDWKNAPLLKGQTSFTTLPTIKSILITGGAGFIASWVARHLAMTYKDSYNIVCFDKLDYCASLNNIRKLHDSKSFTFVCGDVTNPAEVLNCLATYRIDTILHFAAQSHVDLSFGNSYRFTNTNVGGTHVLLEAAKEAKVSRFIHVSTDEVYGEIHKDVGDVLEEKRLAPTNPYSASKAAAEMYVNAYWKSYKLPAIIVRMNNVYGPQQYPEKVIPKFICLLNRGKRLVLQGDGSNSRKYIYAGDVADAFDTILHKGVPGQIYNVDSDDEVSNLELCSKLLKIFKLPYEREEDVEAWVDRGQDRPFNDKRYAVDGRKLRELGWRPKTAFEKGLELTVDWYRNYGETWWGDISPALTPFPVIEGRKLVTDQHDELYAFLQRLKAEMEARDVIMRRTESTRSSRGKRWNRKLGRSRRITYLSFLPLDEFCKVRRSKQQVQVSGPSLERGNMDNKHETSSRMQTLPLILFSLFVVWTIAILAPHQYEKVQHRLPTLKVDFHPNKPMFNESKIALLVEHRPLPHLTPLLLHMMSVVPPDWRFVFVGSRESLNRTNSSSTVRLQQDSGKLELRDAPDVGDYQPNEKVDRMLTNLTFYENYTRTAEWLLVFHPDSVICARSETTVDDWLKYDWIGAPSTIADKIGGNGGLSLRRVSKVKQVLSFQARQDEGEPEDHWLVGRIATLPDANMPPPEVEKRFSVQAVWHERPLGYHISAHGTNRHHAIWDSDERRQKIYEYCPEIKMILDMKLEKERCTKEEMKELQEAQRKKQEKEQKKAAEERKKEEEEERAKEEEEQAKKDER